MAAQVNTHANNGILCSEQMPLSFPRTTAIAPCSFVCSHSRVLFSTESNAAVYVHVMPTSSCALICFVFVISVVKFVLAAVLVKLRTGDSNAWLANIFKCSETAFHTWLKIERNSL